MKGAGIAYQYIVENRLKSSVILPQRCISLLDR